MQPYLDRVLTDGARCARRRRISTVRKVPPALPVRGEPAASTCASRSREADAGRAEGSSRRSDSARVARVDVAGRRQVVAGDEPRGRATLAPSSGTCVPRGAREENGVEADAAVGRGERVAAVRAPVLDHAVDGARVELGAVGERDDRGLRVGR